MVKWPLIFLLAAIIAAALGFSGVAAAATNVAIVLFFVFAGLFLISLLAGPRRRTGGSFFGVLGGVALLAAVAFGAVWFSGDYSLETAGAGMDDTLADARQDLAAVVEDLPGATHDARENLSDALDSAGEAVKPEPEADPSPND
jgi:uncharacterized membrane protein YtjA (UPF0391 family)